ncbi:hypothetical protein SPONL_884 [uncultured Candidatus Thioglobus sp.]|nr:hypothetical protein SPONL_884 [uncultured Candidatus Thioglobus sp.]
MRLKLISRMSNQYFPFLLSATAGDKIKSFPLLKTVVFLTL